MECLSPPKNSRFLENLAWLGQITWFLSPGIDSALQHSSAPSAFIAVVFCVHLGALWLNLYPVPEGGATPLEHGTTGVHPTRLFKLFSPLQGSCAAATMGPEGSALIPSPPSASRDSELDLPLH